MQKLSIVHSTFRIERHYPHAPEKVFAGFSNPEKKRRWMGGDADGFTIESFSMDFKVEGREKWRFRFKGGDIITNDVIYTDIVPDRRIIIAYTMCMGQNRISSSHQTIELIPTDKGTTLILTEQGAFLDGYDNAEAREGGTRALLEELAKELDRHGA